MQGLVAFSSLTKKAVFCMLYHKRLRFRNHSICMRVWENHWRAECLNSGNHKTKVLSQFNRNEYPIKALY